MIGGLAAGALAGLAGGAMAAQPEPKRKRVLRVGHITDVHVFADKRAPERFAACLQEIQSMKDRPDFLLNGGDCIMDAMASSKDSVKGQWKVWNTVLKDNLSLPIHHAIGNHDVWGVNKDRAGLTGNEPLFGKQWPMQELGLADRFYAFSQGGWRFIVLDSIYMLGQDYHGRLDEVQYEWLKAELNEVPKTTPILILSHISLLSGCVFMDASNKEPTDWRVPAAWMHGDARRLVDLFWKHPNVKVAISGHQHLRERLEYNGLTYLCNGAVCGSWWDGNYKQTPPGYAIIDLYNDGTFEDRYIPYKDPA